MFETVLHVTMPNTCWLVAYMTSTKRITIHSIDYSFINPYIHYVYSYSFIQQSFAENNPAGKGDRVLRSGGAEILNTGSGHASVRSRHLSSELKVMKRATRLPGEQGPCWENSQCHKLSMIHLHHSQ